MNTDSHDQSVTEALYKRNHELAILNKILSLLRKLYQISLLTLDPEPLINQLSSAIREDLDLTSVSIIPGDYQTTIPDAKTFPLIARGRTIGFMNVVLNRDYETLSEHERNSITSTVDVVAVALDRANIHRELEAANQKLQIADRTKTQFLSFASHQVKSPMTVVKDYADLIGDGSYGVVPDKVKETAKKIHESADRLISLVNNLLDLRKLDEGKIEYNFADIDINALVKNVFDDLKTLTDAKGLSMTLEIPSGELKIKADSEKLRQVIQNLIDNSIKYTEKGFVKIKIQVLSSKIHIVVSDSGIGIPLDLLPKLFEQFNRGSIEAKKIQGTGLGLYIAKQFVEAHHGRVWAESAGPGRGSAFVVELPYE